MKMAKIGITLLLVGMAAAGLNSIAVGETVAEGELVTLPVVEVPGAEPIKPIEIKPIEPSLSPIAMGMEVDSASSGAVFFTSVRQSSGAISDAQIGVVPQEGAKLPAHFAEAVTIQKAVIEPAVLPLLAGAETFLAKDADGCCTVATLSGVKTEADGTSTATVSMAASSTFEYWGPGEFGMTVKTARLPDTTYYVGLLALGTPFGQAAGTFTTDSDGNIASTSGDLRLAAMAGGADITVVAAPFTAGLDAATVTALIESQTASLRSDVFNHGLQLGALSTQLAKVAADVAAEIARATAKDTEHDTEIAALKAKVADLYKHTAEVARAAFAALRKGDIAKTYTFSHGGTFANLQSASTFYGIALGTKVVQRVTEAGMLAGKLAVLQARLNEVGLELSAATDPKDIARLTREKERLLERIEELTD